MTTLDFLIKHKDVLNISKIEEQAGMPSTTLSGVLSGRRPMPEKYANSINRILT